jgi:hypothetical protein
MATKIPKITLSPETRAAIASVGAKVLQELGQAGARAASASIESIISDVRHEIGRVDVKLREFEKRAKKTHRPNQGDQ